MHDFYKVCIEFKTNILKRHATISFQKNSKRIVIVNIFSYKSKLNEFKVKLTPFALFFTELINNIKKLFTTTISPETRYQQSLTATYQKIKFIKPTEIYKNKS